MSALLRDAAESDLDAFYEQKADEAVPTILNLWLGRIRKSGCYVRSQSSRDAEGVAHPEVKLELPNQEPPRAGLEYEPRLVPRGDRARRFRRRLPACYRIELGGGDNHAPEPRPVSADHAERTAAATAATTPTYVAPQPPPPPPPPATTAAPPTPRPPVKRAPKKTPVRRTHEPDHKGAVAARRTRLNSKLLPSAGERPRPHLVAAAVPVPPAATTHELHVPPAVVGFLRGVLRAPAGGGCRRGRSRARAAVPALRSDRRTA